MNSMLEQVFAVPGNANLTLDRSLSMNYIAQYLWPEDILLDIEAGSKAQLFEEVARLMEREHDIPRNFVVPGLLRREQVASTGLGRGIAIPHARVEGLHQIQMAYLRLKTPIAFDSPDELPVSDVLVILVPKQPTEEHLKILADASRMLGDDRFMSELHAASRPLEVKSLFASFPLK